MAYNQDNYRRIRQEYDIKYLRARENADLRRAEVHAALPEIEEIDRKLGSVGLEIMRISYEGGDIETAIADLRTSVETLQRRRRLVLVAGGFPADYTDVHYDCPLCADTGFVDCKMCSCMKKKLVEAGFASSGMGELLKRQSFDNFKLDYYADSPQNLQRMTRVRNIMKEYADTFNPGSSGNLVLFGGTGLGKTHLSTAVARVVIDKGCDVYYTSAVGMLSDFEHQRFGNAAGVGNQSDTARYYDCDLLIIDDLGTEVCNQFTTSILYDVINTRLNRRRSTLISTNLGPDEFRHRYWDRITSRVLGEYAVLVFCGHDIRAQKLGGHT